MFDKPNASHSLGLEVEDSIVKIAILVFSRGKPILDSVFDLTLEKKESKDLVNPLYITDSEKLAHLIEKNLCISNLNTEDVLVRPIEIKLKKMSDIDAVLGFQAEPILPYPVENAVIDRINLGQTPEGTSLTLLAARKDHLDHHLEFWHNNKIEPEIISCIPASLSIFSKHFVETTAPLFILHLGWDQTSCILAKEGKLFAAQSFSKGISNLESAYKSDISTEDEEGEVPFSLLDFGVVETSLTPSLVETRESIRLEIMRLFYALSKQSKGDEIHEILITGEGGGLLNLPEALCQNLGKKIITPQPSQQFPLTTQELQKYAVSIGSALSAMPKSKDQVNFRLQEYSYPDRWKRTKKPITIYFLLCLLAAIAFYFFGEAYLGQREDDLKKEYVDLLVLMNKPYHEFEEEFSKKFPQSDIPSGSEKPLKDLTQEELTNRIQYLQKELNSTPDTFPLLPNVPSVSDVLAWLNTHSSLMGAQKEETSSTQPLQIESFNYSLVKRPEQSKKNEKYQVKVELEFTSPTPKQAREFHDALIEPNNFVDPKAEVKWSSNRGKYKTSFFLKDRTIYPSSS